MGRLVKRHWDPRERSTRRALPGDPPRDLFDSFVPHPIHGWRFGLDPELADVLAESETRVALFNRQHGADRIACAEWLMRRAESVASSTIEGIHPSARRLARAEARARHVPVDDLRPEAEALRNIAAFERAASLPADRGVSLDDLLEVHSELMGGECPNSGMLRAVQNWIGGGLHSTPLNSAFVGPPPEAVPPLMEDLLRRINDPVGPPLMEIAVVHAQFETIHPFTDGNGRTGRALMQMMLRRTRLAARGTLPLSAPLARRRADYMDALNEFHLVCHPDAAERGEACAAVIRLVCEAASDAADQASELIRRVERVEDRWRRIAAEAGLRHGSAAQRLLGVLPHNPLLDIGQAAALLGAAPATARRALQRLEGLGVLVQRSAARRLRVFEAEAIMALYAAATDTSSTSCAERNSPMPPTAGVRPHRRTKR